MSLYSPAKDTAVSFEKVTEMASDFVKFSNATPAQKRAVNDAWADAFLTQ